MWVSPWTVGERRRWRLGQFPFADFLVTLVVKAANGVTNAQALVKHDADQLQAFQMPSGGMWIDRPVGTGTGRAEARAPASVGDPGEQPTGWAGPGSRYGTRRRSTDGA